MKKLFEAIDAQLDDTDFKNAVSGFYNGEAPKGVAAPYAVFKMLGNTKSYLYGNTVRDIMLSISIVSKSTSVIEASGIYEYLLDAVDEQIFSVEDWIMVDCTEENATLLRIKDEYVYDVTMHVQLKKEGNEHLTSRNVMWDLLGM